MSAISEKIRAALYAKLNVSAVTSLATGGVHESKAPAEALMPYVIYRRQAAEPVEYTFGPTPRLESDLWLVKAVTEDDSNASYSPQGLAAAITEACEAAIGDSLTITGAAVVWCTRFADMPPYEEKQGDRFIYHRGFLVRIKTEPT